MKKWYWQMIPVFAALLIIVMPVMPVYADAIWEPYGDFYEQHYKECETVAKNYRINSKEGYVTIYESPVSSREVAKMMNGKTVYVGCSFQDKKGNVWAAVELGYHELSEGESLLDGISSGWLLMEELTEIYGEGNFTSEYMDEFSEYTGELDSYEIKNALIMWEYPGSGIVSDELSAYFNEGEPPFYEYIYTDSDGLRWTRINYYYGIRSCWVCIDEPENENLTTSYGPGVIEKELYPAQVPDGELKTVMDDSYDGNIKLAAALVAAVAVITAVLIAVIFGRKKGKKQDEIS